MQGLAIENGKFVWAGAPKDTTGAIFAGDWVHLVDYRNLAIILLQGAWAGGTPAVTLNQSKSAAGGSSKALAFSTVYQTTGLTVDTPVITAVVANTFNLVATANSMNVIEVQQKDLDFMNGFDWVNFSIATPGANADLIAALYYLYNPRWAAKPSILPTAIA